MCCTTVFDKYLDRFVASVTSSVTSLTGNLSISVKNIIIIEVFDNIVLYDHSRFCCMR